MNKKDELLKENLTFFRDNYTKLLNSLHQMETLASTMKIVFDEQKSLKESQRGTQEALIGIRTFLNEINTLVKGIPEPLNDVLDIAREIQNTNTSQLPSDTIISGLRESILSAWDERLDIYHQKTQQDLIDFYKKVEDLFDTREISPPGEDKPTFF